MDRLIEIKINGSHLTKDNLYAGVQGEANVTALRIEFDESWDGYLKTVVFWDAKGENPVKRTLNAGMLEDAANSRIYRCMIPGEPLAEAGECTIIVDGYVEGKRPRTIPVKLKVRPAPDSENAAAPTDPTPTQTEHLQEQIDTLEEKFEGVVEAIENIPEGTATPIVNNLVTGGTTMALSAEMGKVLKQELDGRANTNLLDNWYFANPVNQRGQAEYTTPDWVAHYCIDRWFLTASTWDVANCRLTAHSNFGRMVQYFDGTDLVGKTVTFSVLVRSTSGGGIMLLAGPGDYGLVEEPEGFAGVLSTTITVRDPGISINSFSVIVPTAGASVVIEAAKLELGTQQTLARRDADGKWVLTEIPDYSEQMLKCCTSKAHVGDDYTGKVVLHTGNMAQYIGVAQASLEE